MGKKIVPADSIERIIILKARKSEVSKPTILDLRRAEDRMLLKRLHASNKIQHIIDDYKEQQRELFAVKNPRSVYTKDFNSLFARYYMGLEKRMRIWRHGRWVYLPWISTLTHILEDKDFQLVRTARNKNLINKKEQDKFYNAVIGIAGLSVGSSVVSAIVLQGGGRHLRIADFDRLALSNTNRVRAGIQDLGVLKTEITARQIYEVNPYAKVEIFSQGLTKENIKKFFAGPPKLDIVIDEIDNLAVKLLIREHAKKYRLPVVMAADNGDNAVVDIEGYDKNPGLRYFHGRLGKVTYEKLLGLDKFGIGKTITKHIGPENVTIPMQESLLEMGKSIVSWPQLGGAALLNGAAVAYCVRKILNRQPIENNRAVISLDEKLTPNYGSTKERHKRARVAHAFKKTMGL